MFNQNPIMNNLASNPIFQLAMSMGKGKNVEELKQIATNICKEKGLDINEAYQAFQQQFKGVIPFK